MQSASTRFPPVRSRRWPSRESPISRYILKWNELNSPLRRCVTIGEVGNAALFLLSDLGCAVTGECLHVDAGYHVVGMKAEDAPDIAVTKSDQ